MTHFADWSIVIVVYRLREPVARQKATLNGNVSALVVACVPRKSAIESGPCSAAIADNRSPTSRVAVEDRQLVLAPPRGEEAIRARVQRPEATALHARVALRERVLGVAADRRHLPVGDLDLQPADAGADPAERRRHDTHFTKLTVGLLASARR